MNNHIKISLLWVVLALCMNMHFDYHASDFFCGISNNLLLADNAGVNAEQPAMGVLALQVVPMLLVAIFMFVQNKALRWANVVLAATDTLFNGAHFTSTLSQEPFDTVQVTLLLFTFGFSVVLTIISWNWVNELSDSA